MHHLRILPNCSETSKLPWQELDNTKTDLAEKDRLLRSRDTLLESSGMETRRLTDLLERSSFMLDDRINGLMASSAAWSTICFQDDTTARNKSPRVSRLFAVKIAKD